VSLSSHGTEDGTLHVFDVSKAKLVDVRIPRIALMGGSLAWRADASGFWYTRYPAPGERADEDLRFYQEVWFHQIGRTLDSRDLGGVFADDRIVENFLSSSPDGKWVLDRAQRGDGGEWEIFVRSQDDGAWWRLAAIPDQIVDAALDDDQIFLLSRKDAPHGQILMLPLAWGATVSQATVVVPASPLAIEGLAVTDGRVWVLDMDGGVSGLRAFDLDGAPHRIVELPPICAINQVVRLGDDEVAYPVETFVSPPAWWVARDGERGPR